MTLVFYKRLLAFIQSCVCLCHKDSANSGWEAGKYWLYYCIGRQNGDSMEFKREIYKNLVKWKQADSGLEVTFDLFR